MKKERPCCLHYVPLLCCAMRCNRYIPFNCLITEICAVSRHSKKDIGRCFKLIHKAMNTPVAVVDPEDFMVRLSGATYKDACAHARVCVAVFVCACVCAL